MGLFSTFQYMKNAVMVCPDKPVINGQHCFELVSSHQQRIHMYMYMYTVYISILYI